MVGEVLSKYKILEEIGQGGMAVVYRGLDTSLNREVAVKVLHSHLADREESRERFQREAHAVARLRHENILEIFDYSGMSSERNFIVMEFIHGVTLKDFLDDFALMVPELGAMILVEVCKALSHAHATGIIHRDIKPENILVRDDGVIKLTDFGIASMVDTQKLTVTGQLLGSPAYMAPEMVTGERLDFRTDVFSVGILLYRLTVGELPFKGKNPHEVLKRIAEVDYIRPHIAQPRVGEALSRIIARALRADPEDRYDSIESLQADLDRHLAEMEITDTRAELEAFFADPAGHQAAFEQRLVRILLERGQAEMRRANHARAFSLCNRVLAFDPHNREVKEHLERLGRRRNLRYFLKIALLVVLIGGAGLGVAWGVQRLRSSSPGRAPMLGVADGGGLAAGTDLDAAVALPPFDATTRRRALPDASPPSRARDATARERLDAARRPPEMRRWVLRRPPRPRKRRFVLGVTPPIWLLYVDGKRVSKTQGTPTIIELGPGAHTLVFRDPSGAAYPLRYPIRPDMPGRTIVGQLRWHRARLRVVGSPPSAHWQLLSPPNLRSWAVGKNLRLGKTFPIPIERLQGSGVRAQIRVYRRGYKSTVRQLTLEPNKLTRVEVRLQPLR